jgi:enamine deaminase RidA (YjgF/YER057c/UK114 family)
MAPTRHFPPPAGVKAPPLSFATRVGDLLFISGIPGFDENRALPDGFEAQFGNVVTNIKRVLDEAGGTFRDLAKVNVLLTRASDVATMNVLYASAFGPAPYPARTTCVVQALPDPKMLIEIEGVASLKS